MGALRLILGLLAAVAIVSFGVLNMQPVSVSYHRIGTVNFPLFYILLGFFVAGFAVAWLGGVFDRLRFHNRFRAYRRHIRALEKEVEREKRKSGRLLPAAVESGSNGEAAHSLPASASSESTPSSEASPGSAPSREEDRNVSLN